MRRTLSRREIERWFDSDGRKANDGLADEYLHAEQQLILQLDSFHRRWIGARRGR